MLQKDQFEKLANRNLFHEDLYEEIIEKRSRGHVILSGDLNSRTSNLIDYLPNEDIEHFAHLNLDPRRKLEFSYSSGYF